MKTVVEMTREAGGFDVTPEFLERFAELVRADEREIAIERAFVAMLGASHELTLRVVRAIRAGKT
jgi:hypothetical protein